MWITIGTKRITLSPRMRRNIEVFVSSVFQRERRQIDSCVLSIGPAKLGGGESGLTCRLRLWSSYLGSIAIRETGDTLRTVIQKAALRARQVVRRRLHKRRSQSRRLGHNRLNPWLQGLTADQTTSAGTEVARTT
jgi:hypothetical protein